MSVNYEMTFTVPAKKVGAALEVMGKFGQLKTMKATEETAIATKTIHYVGGKKNKGIRSDALALELLGNFGGVMSYEGVKSRFEERGFAASSVSPTMSRLIHEGKVVRDGKYFRLVTKGA